jgi:hypothetical protein
MTTLPFTITPSLENKLESAYGALLNTIPQFSGDAMPILLASSQLVNNADDRQEAGDDSNKPIPNITLTAKGGAESLPNCGVREMTLTIEYTDNASREGSDGQTTDDYFSLAITPLFIKIYDDGNGHTYTLAQLLSAQVTDFHCYGFANAQRIVESDMRKEGDLVTRSATAVFQVTGLND